MDAYDWSSLIAWIVMLSASGVMAYHRDWVVVFIILGTFIPMWLFSFIQYHFTVSH